MLQSLLMLMLTATQILAGSGGTIYLCISNEGSYCCIDHGPEACKCCRQAPHVSCTHHESRAVAGGCCEHHDRVVEQKTDRSDQVAIAACGCTHIPISVSAELPVVVVRSRAADTLHLASADALPASMTALVEAAAAARDCVRAGRPTAIPDFALTVVATVVMRC